MPIDLVQLELCLRQVLECFIEDPSEDDLICEELQDLKAICEDLLQDLQGEPRGGTLDTVFEEEPEDALEEKQN